MEREVNLIRDIGRVKKVKRAGWVREGIPDVESVADHSFRVAVMAMVFGDRLEVDTNRLIRIALVHDIAEGVKGDIVVERGTQIDHQARQNKDEEEIDALRKIFGGIADTEEIVQLQSDETSPEARMLKQLERLEMAVQALEYEEEFGKDLSEFFENADLHITHPYLKDMLQTVQSLRPQRNT